MIWRSNALQSIPLLGKPQLLPRLLRSFRRPIVRHLCWHQQVRPFHLSQSPHTTSQQTLSLTQISCTCNMSSDGCSASLNFCIVFARSARAKKSATETSFTLYRLTNYRKLDVLKNLERQFGSRNCTESLLQRLLVVGSALASLWNDTTVLWAVTRQFITANCARWLQSAKSSR